MIGIVKHWSHRGLGISIQATLLNLEKIYHYLAASKEARLEAGRETSSTAGAKHYPRTR